MARTRVRLKFKGPFSMRLTSAVAGFGMEIAAHARHAFGQRLEPAWSADLEAGVRFMQRQFTLAMNHASIEQGRLIADSLMGYAAQDVYDVAVEPCDQPKGHWIIPKKPESKATLLYLHGGGYTFYLDSTRHFAQTLAHRCAARLFAPDYRLTPEHPHPAQAEDALAAWRYVAASTPPENLVVIGDSAGGHMALTLLTQLQEQGLPQPALCIGICPWTDIGERGASFYGNDRYDVVQGWIALKFGEWLDPEGRYGRAALSPISRNYRGLAPLYLQAGGREVLYDMIRDFAQIQSENGADVLLDVWPDMHHVFQYYDSLHPPAPAEALARIRAAIQGFVDKKGEFAAGPNTVLKHGRFG